MQIYFLSIYFSQNNIFLTLTNSKGATFFWKSLGMFKTKGLKKLVPLNLKNFIFLCFNKSIMSSLNIKIHVRFKGFNKCKKLFTKLLLGALDDKIISICDNSLKPNNGCKLKKNRRL